MGDFIRLNSLGTHPPASGEISEEIQKWNISCTISFDGRLKGYLQPEEYNSECRCLSDFYCERITGKKTQALRVYVECGKGYALHRLLRYSSDPEPVTEVS